MTSQPATLSGVWPEVERTARRLGAIGVGACPLEDPNIAWFERWLDDGLEAGMAYLRRSLDVRQNPGERYPRGRSAIVLTVPYQPDRPAPTPDNIAAHIARYAQGDDYHDVIDHILRELETELSKLVPDIWTWRYVDTGPLSDRSLAHEAGLGWIGRNGMLIDPELGSYFFIGVLLTSLEHDLDVEEVADRCGECTRCVDACPTDAIRGDRLVDSNRCISYLTIEHRGPISDDFADHLHDNLFGCDICQEVCPWNEYAPEGLDEFQTRENYRNTPVSDLLRLSQADFSSMFRRSAVKRAKRAGLIRNTVLVSTSMVSEDFQRLASERDEGIQAAMTRRRV